MGEIGFRIASLEGPSEDGDASLWRNPKMGDRAGAMKSESTASQYRR
jgi:hypothetical protein